MYRIENADVYRVLSSEGKEAFCEGMLEYHGDQLYRDDSGRTYYQVSGRIFEDQEYVDYFVEVEPVSEKIPVRTGSAEKDISGLVVTSPRDRAEVKEEPTENILADTEADVDACKKIGTVPEPETHNIKKDTGDITATPIAKESMPSRKARKNLMAPVVLAAISLILIATAGIYLIKPDIGNILTPSATPAATPEATVQATPATEPEVTPTAEPAATPAPEDSILFQKMSSAIDMENESVRTYALAQISPASLNDSSKIAQVFDLYDHINKKWKVTVDYSLSPVPASASTGSMRGTILDYSVLMCALTQSIDVESRVIVSYNDNRAYYYPEIRASPNEATFKPVRDYIKSRYGVQNPYMHVEAGGCWLSLDRGSAPGTGVISTAEYAVYPDGTVEKIL